MPKRVWRGFVRPPVGCAKTACVPPKERATTQQQQNEACRYATVSGPTLLGALGAQRGPQARAGVQGAMAESFGSAVFPPRGGSPASFYQEHCGPRQFCAHQSTAISLDAAWPGPKIFHFRNNTTPIYCLEQLPGACRLGCRFVTILPLSHRMLAIRYFWFFFKGVLPSLHLSFD